MQFGKVINSDLMKFIPTLPQNSVDLIVTSPPYNCGIPYRTYQDNKQWKEYLEWCQIWIRQLYRVCKDDGRIALNVPVQMCKCGYTQKKKLYPMKQFMIILQRVGFHIMSVPMWTDTQRVKLTAWGSWLSCSSPYIYNPFEVIILAYKNSIKKLNKGKDTISKEDFIKGVSGIWDIFPDTRSLTIATFPVELPKLCIELLSYQNDVVLDPFSGSGTTAVACQMTNRRFVGCQLDDQYCKIANHRIQQSKNKQMELEF